MTHESLMKLSHQLEGQDDSQEMSIEELTPEEAEVLDGGGKDLNYSCPHAPGYNVSCPMGNSGCV